MSPDRRKIYQSNQELSLLGEELAARHFQIQDYRILERRYRSRFGEIDLIAINKNRIAFIEVKTRRHRDYGDPLEAITPKKCQSLFRCARVFLDQWKTKTIHYKPEFWGVGILLTGDGHELEAIPLFLA